MAKRAHLKKYLDLKFNLKDDKAPKLFGGMSSRVRALFTGIPADIGKEVGSQMRLGILDNFASQSSEKAGAWPMLSKGYKKWKDLFYPGELIGQRTHQMIESISFKIEGRTVIAGVIPGGGTRKQFKQATAINALWNEEAKADKHGAYRGIETLPPAEEYAGDFLKRRDFLTIPFERTYDIRRSIWYWVVQGKVRTTGGFGRDIS